MKPMHTHDCDGCTFLGTVLVKGVTVIDKQRTFGDLWLSCQANSYGSRYILRMSSDGPDYITARPEDLPLYL